MVLDLRIDSPLYRDSALRVGIVIETLLELFRSHGALQSVPELALHTLR